MSSSRLVAAASKTLQSVRSRQACKTCSVSLYSLYYKFSRFKFLPVGWYKMNQAVIRGPQICLWNRAICILYIGVTVIQYITFSGGTCKMLSVFWQFRERFAWLKSPRMIKTWIKMSLGVVVLCLWSDLQVSVELNSRALAVECKYKNERANLPQRIERPTVNKECF